MDDEYGKPGDPRPYREPPRELSGEEHEFFAALDLAYWRETSPDKFGTVRRTPKGKMTHAQTERLFNLVLDCRLMTKIGSGMFGLSGYSMTIYEVPPVHGMLEEDPRRLFTLMSDHMPWYRESGDLRSQSQRDWICFTSFTHSPENFAMLDHHKVRRPRIRSDYDY